MSVASNSKSAKILILNQPHLPTKELENLVDHCLNIGELRKTLEKYNSFSRIIACTSAQLTELVPILSRTQIDALYILNIGDEMKCLGEPWWNRTTVVYTERQLMRHLCMKSMLCCYNEGLEHRKQGDFGLANISFLDSIRALDYSAKFM
ncbi:unnamed protein product [Rotaria magnacalcarata]|uniref:Uncharacterized protein n=1 Tax=Rotaria magnacalcarata TaxID=392030 RepID=A0A816RJH3_9BILA|nr:unnamed protein product [Rotaria magnacalcarata]CAF2074083.1 unnamed protein product [Rotaria magnacalcarata]CAF2117366.1 unnamed protein product [Rotaria magnacalcarata]CAF2124416.1 unnamed protein product [Rotaria magnacalcarata]CAF3759660.1 unnamed protein product [Rotaria magnacalcarata]